MLPESPTYIATPVERTSDANEKERTKHIDGKTDLMMRITKTIINLTESTNKEKQEIINALNNDSFQKVLDWKRYLDWSIEDLASVYAQACTGQLPDSDGQMGPMQMNRWAILHFNKQSTDLLNRLLTAGTDSQKHMPGYREYEDLLEYVEKTLYRFIDNPEISRYEDIYSNPGTFYRLIYDHLPSDKS